MKRLLLIGGRETTPSRVVKLQNGNWFGLCVMCGHHSHSLTWKTAFWRTYTHVKVAHTYVETT